MKQLEAELGVTLLTRTTRRVELTDAGERFQRCLRVLEEAEGAIDEVRGEHGGMQGILRVTSTVEYAARVLAPMLHAFTARHPALRVRLETHTSQADLVRDRFDVAIRLGRHEHFLDLPYRGVCLATCNVLAVMAPDLPAKAGAPASPGDLARLPQLGHTGSSESPNGRSPIAQATNMRFDRRRSLTSSSTTHRC